MRKVLALIRVGALTAASYRLNMLLSLAALLVSIVPVFYVAQALQPVAENAIRAESKEYFAFVLVGLVTVSFITVALSAVPTVVASATGNGTMEALLSTPTGLPTLLAGLTGYGFLWTVLRAVVMLAFGAALGVHFQLVRVPAAMLILALIILAYLPIGILSGALVLAFRTSGPLTSGVLLASNLLGGVYYPVHVIPSWWLKDLALLMPLTYGLRALRRTLLEGRSLAEVAPDVAALAGFAVVLFALSALAFRWSLSFAKRTGTLAQY